MTAVSMFERTVSEHASGWGSERHNNDMRAALFAAIDAFAASRVDAVSTAIGDVMGNGGPR
ncbi:MAG: hypothetical protein WC211_00570 [Dehalococcoidia bacterium]